MACIKPLVAARNASVSALGSASILICRIGIMGSAVVPSAHADDNILAFSGISLDTNWSCMHCLYDARMLSQPGTT